jgi:tetratricopeptide (TPR) repeat protein
VLQGRQLVIICAVAAIGAATARAQAPTSAAATVQFDRGRALFKEQRYAEACAAFEQSQKLEPASGTLYNLAGCYLKIGKLASAWVAYRDLGQRDTNPRRRAESVKQARDLEPRLPRLALKPSASPPGLVVTMNGQDVTALAGVESPVDLGTFRVTAKAPGFRDFETQVEVVAEGKTVSVALELQAEQPREPVAAVEPRPAPIVATRPPIEDEAPPSNRRLYGGIAAGAGVAAIATGLVFGNLARGKWRDAKKLCGDDLTCEPDQAVAGKRLSDAAHRDGNIATGLVIGGVAVAGLGAYLWLSAPSRDDRTALRLVPGSAAADVGVSLLGGF